MLIRMLWSSTFHRYIHTILRPSPDRSPNLCCTRCTVSPYRWPSGSRYTSPRCRSRFSSDPFWQVLHRSHLLAASPLDHQAGRRPLWEPIYRSCIWKNPGPCRSRSEHPAQRHQPHQASAKLPQVKQMQEILALSFVSSPLCYKISYLPETGRRVSPVVICGTPGFVWVVKLHGAESLEGVGAQILLVHPPLIATNPSLHPS